VLNLTPHKVVVSIEGGELVLPPTPDRPSARVSVDATPADSVKVNGRDIPVFRQTFGAIEGWTPQDGPAIVSRMVLEAASADAPLFSPDTGPTAVRDVEGRIMSVRGFVTR